MPQLDIVTYFPQSIWFTFLFWGGFFYFLYDMFPIFVNLFKVRETFGQKLVGKRNALNKYYAKKVGSFNALGGEYMVPAHRWVEDQSIKGFNLALQNTKVNEIFNLYFLMNRKFV